MKNGDQIIQTYVPTKVANLRVTFPKEHSNVPLGVLYLSENCNCCVSDYLFPGAPKTSAVLTSGSKT